MRVGSVVLSVALLVAAPLLAQSGGGTDDVDLDAPDAAEAPRSRWLPPAEQAPPGPGAQKPASSSQLAPATPKPPSSPPPVAAPSTPAAPRTVTAAPGSSPAAAPGAPASAPGAPSPSGVGAPAVADSEGAFDVVPWSVASLREKTAPHFRAAARGEIGLLRRTLGELQGALVEGAVHGVVGGYEARAIGAALARQAEAAVVDGRTDDAAEIVDAALRAAPDDVGVALHAAHVRWKSEGAAAAINEAGGVARRLAVDVMRTADVAGRAAAVAIAAILALLFFFVVVVALPMLRYCGFDLWLLLPRASHQQQGLLFALLLASLPFVVGAGVVVGALWVMTLAFLYLPRRGRVVGFFVGALACALPAAVDAWSRALAIAGSDVERLSMALYDVDGAAELDDLRAKDAAGVDLPVLERAALAAAARREGRLDEALERWRVIAQRHADQAWVHGAYGVALATAGRDEVALGELGICLERAGADAHLKALAAFNASVLHFKAGRTEQGQAVVAGLVGPEASLMAEMRRATFRNPDERVPHNRAFVEILPPRRLLVARAFESGAQSTAIAAQANRTLWHGLSGSVATTTLALFPLTWLVLALLAPRLKPARACGRCGAPASRRVDASEVPDDTCSACFHAFLSKKSRVEAVVKLRKEREILARGKRRAAVIVLCSLIPGAGHLFAGAVARGALLLLVCALAAGGIVTTSTLVPGPAAAGPFGAAPLVVCCALVLLVLLAGSVRGALALADDERAGGPR